MAETWRSITRHLEHAHLRFGEAGVTRAVYSIHAHKISANQGEAAVRLTSGTRLTRVSALGEPPTLTLRSLAAIEELGKHQHGEVREIDEVP